MRPALRNALLVAVVATAGCAESATPGLAAPILGGVSIIAYLVVLVVATIFVFASYENDSPGFLWCFYRALGITSAALLVISPLLYIITGHWRFTVAFVLAGIVGIAVGTTASRRGPHENEP